MNARTHKLLRAGTARPVQRGVLLIEAMVALLVMAFGMVALVGLLGNLRYSSDVAKQRSEAMRLAQAELATLRSFSVVNKPEGSATGVSDYDNDVVTPAEPRHAPSENSSALFTLNRVVSAVVKDKTEPQARTVSITVSWADRAGSNMELRMDSMISRADPAFSGALSIAPTVAGVRLPDGRNPVIPINAKDLGNGSSAFRPDIRSKTVWVFNNVTGVIVGKCEIKTDTPVSGLTAADVESCKNNTFGYLVSGTIRFSSTAPASPSAPIGVMQPVSVYLALTPSEFKVQKGVDYVKADGGEYPISPNYECFNEAATDSTTIPGFVNYNCIVYPNNQTPRNWWGTVLLSGLNLGTTSAESRVCRYSADYNGNGYTYRLISAETGAFQIDNEEHPDVYRGVSRSLARQNFLVVRGDVGCPKAPAVDPSAGIFIDYSTIQLQPS